MKRRSGIVAILLLALIVVVAASVLVSWPERVFTVAEVQRGLATQPRQWVNRAIIVRGVFRYSMSDAGTFDVFHPPPYVLVTYAIYQPGPARVGGISGQPLTLKLAPHLAAPRTNALIAMLRQVPGLQGLLGSPSASVFRITLLPPQRNGCFGQACADAQLDEQPW